MELELTRFHEQCEICIYKLKDQEVATANDDTRCSWQCDGGSGKGGVVTRGAEPLLITPPLSSIENLGRKLQAVKKICAKGSTVTPVKQMALIPNGHLATHFTSWISRSVNICIPSAGHQVSRLRCRQCGTAFHGIADGA